MLAFKENIRIQEGQITISLPLEFNNKEAEVIVLLTGRKVSVSAKPELSDTKIPGITIPTKIKRTAKMPVITATGLDMALMVSEGRR